MTSYRAYLDVDYNRIDETSIDEFSFQLAYDLFVEFGHEDKMKEGGIVEISLEAYDSTDEG